MKVHSHFGSGFPEIIYKRALLLDLDSIGVSYVSEIKKDIHYNGTLIGGRRLDIIIENKILLELKAFKELDKVSFVQIINYLKVFDFKVGLLLNFGAESLQFKRFLNTR